MEKWKLLSLQVPNIPQKSLSLENIGKYPFFGATVGWFWGSSCWNLIATCFPNPGVSVDFFEKYPMANPFIAHPLLIIFKKHANLLADPPPQKKGATKNDEIFSMPSFYYWPWRTCSQMLKMVHLHLKLERENLANTYQYKERSSYPFESMIFLLTKGGFTGGYGINLPKSPLPTVANLPSPTWLRNLSKSTRWQPDRLILKKNRLSYTFIPKNPDSIFSLQKTGPKLRHATGLTFKAAFPWTKGGYRAWPGAKSALVWKFLPFLEPRWHTSLRNVGGKKHTGGNPLSFMIGLIYYNIHLIFCTVIFDPRWVWLNTNQKSQLRFLFIKYDSHFLTLSCHLPYSQSSPLNSSAHPPQNHPPPPILTFLWKQWVDQTLFLPCPSRLTLPHCALSVRPNGCVARVPCRATPRAVRRSGWRDQDDVVPTDSKHRYDEPRCLRCHGCWMGVNPKMVGFPNNHGGFPTKNERFGVWNGGKPTS